MRCINTYIAVACRQGSYDCRLADNDLLIYSCLLIFSIHGKGSPGCTFNLDLRKFDDFWEDFTLYDYRGRDDSDSGYLNQVTFTFNPKIKLVTVQGWYKYVTWVAVPAQKCKVARSIFSFLTIN